MNNHIFQHQDVYLYVLPLLVNNTFLSPIMHILQYIIGINIHNGPKLQVPRTSAYSPYLKESMLRTEFQCKVSQHSKIGILLRS